MTTSLAILLALTPVLAVLCYTDCKLRRLPNAITIPLACAALVWRLGYGGVELAMLGLGGGLVCFLFLLIPFLMKGVGGGDLKMFFAVGCAIGLKRVAGFLLCTSIAGVILAVVMICVGLADARRLKHYANCIFNPKYDRKAGRESLPPASDERVRVPYGVAISLGTVFTLVIETLLVRGGAQ